MRVIPADLPANETLREYLSRTGYLFDDVVPEWMLQDIPQEELLAMPWAVAIIVDMPLPLTAIAWAIQYWTK